MNSINISKSMNIYLPLALVVLLVNINCNLSESKKPNDLELENLKGKVRTITFEQYRIEEIIKTDSKDSLTYMHKYLDKKHVVNYNIKGFKTDRIDYKWNGKIDDYINYKYLPDGKLIEGPEGEYFYDKSGNLYLTVYTQKGSGKKRCTKYIYNSKELLAEKLVYNYDSQLVRYYSYEYDSRNKLAVSYYKYFGDAYTYRTNEKSEYFYDSAFNLVKIKTTGLNTSYTDVQEMKRNERNDIVFLKLSNLSSNEETVNTFEYEYDSQNNWIKKRIYLDQKLEAVYERSIDYYP